ncbi:GNAT family N-acetyltransferase [Gimesia chilikensis]|uniref:GNAT family N-acetyltransferase n=1 Tax=Gimesia chilikensis TaxID=2605989 RepID=UPI001187F0C2|nr:GNAT family N-acetyltransferase [Gimesia chilikensis]MCR9232797.1 GNAT family N-acetyltransferase [bacterium]QDT82554.1 hypothetical protein MalM14_01810 [Gimesia chilikensis]
METTRLILRRWCEDDVTPFVELNKDPRVMQYYPSTLTSEQSMQMMDDIQKHFEEYGFGLWAVEIKDQTPFAGFIGLAVPQFTAFFTPCIEILWRLATPYWNQGYATEGAHAVLDFGFDECNLKQIVSFTVPSNIASRRVMEKIGMSYIDNFDHPGLPDNDPLQRHVLYSINRSERDGLLPN